MAMDVIKTQQISPRPIKKVIFHPLALLSMVDHYNRVARDTQKRVVGFLLGSSFKGTVDVNNSYAVPFEEDDDPSIWFLDHKYHKSMFSMFKRINVQVQSCEKMTLMSTDYIPSRLQVHSIPQFSRNKVRDNAAGPNFPNGSVSSSNSSQIVSRSMYSNSNNNNKLNSSSSVKVQDISNEIIVISREVTAEALTALTTGFPADSLTYEEIDVGVVKVVGGIEQLLIYRLSVAT